jgi:N-acetyl-beta-hexosaminidase
MKQTKRQSWPIAAAFLMSLGLSLKAQVNVLPTPEMVEVLSGTHRYLPSEEILFTAGDEELGQEGYELEISRDAISISALGPAGNFYAFQTLRQLLQDADAGELPCLRIKDRPKYSWRSFMIDSGRQYQRVETIKGLLDRMAMLKMNVFHWHLTENDGWRIEIKRYPKLTAVGAYVANGKEQKGFYTQDEIREIVAYAAERHITVVPEIDIPGHADAALLAYPEMSCSGKPPKGGPGQSPYLFCGGSTEVEQFLFNVLDEVCEMFPGPYIHIGGDEAPKSEWDKCRTCQDRIRELCLENSHELQVDLSNRIARHLSKKGRTAICWGDVLTLPGPDLEDNIVVQWWNWRRHKDKALRQAIRRKMKVIANTNYYTYLNFPETPWRGYDANRTFDLRACYERNPSDIVEPTAEERAALLGMGCSLWTDYNLTEDMLDYRLFPRIFALAEQMWSRAERPPFAEFRRRVYAKRSILAEQGIQGRWDE